MTNLVSLFSLLFFISQQVFSQCVPDPIYANASFGVWPDTTENLPPTQPNVYYETVVNIKTPADATELGYPLPLTVDKLSIDGISGLPPGFSYNCNTPDCSWGGNEQGCITIYGTSSEEKLYHLIFHTSGESGTLSNNYDVKGYKILVSTATGLNTKRRNLAITVFPNPITNKINIEFADEKPDLVTVEIYNMLGQSCLNTKYLLSRGNNRIPLDVNFPSGVYSLNIKGADYFVQKQIAISE